MQKGLRLSRPKRPGKVCRVIMGLIVSAVQALHASEVMAARATTAEAVSVTAFGKTDAGIVREVNEDAFGMADLTAGERWQGGKATTWSAGDAGVLLEVSDGMGGAKAGEVASALAIEGVLEGMLDVAKAGETSDKTLRAVIERVSKRIYEAGKRPDRRGM